MCGGGSGNDGAGGGRGNSPGRGANDRDTFSGAGGGRGTDPGRGANDRDTFSGSPDAGGGRGTSPGNPGMKSMNYSSPPGAGGGRGTSPGRPAPDGGGDAKSIDWQELLFGGLPQSLDDLSPSKQKPGAVMDFAFGMIPGINAARQFTRVMEALGVPGTPPGDDLGDEKDERGGNSILGPMVSQSQGYSRPGMAALPNVLNFDPAMTELQRRAAIATYATHSGEGPYKTVDASNYYDNLLRRALISDTGALNPVDSLLPVERQYLSQFRGINPTTTETLLNAIGTA